MAQLIASYSSDESPVGSEQLFTAKNAFDFIALNGEGEQAQGQEVGTLVGNLCTAANGITKDILMPKLKCGDVVVITNTGSYASGTSPMQFSSPAPPAELFLTVEGKVLYPSKQGQVFLKTLKSKNHSYCNIMILLQRKVRNRIFSNILQ